MSIFLIFAFTSEILYHMHSRLLTIVALTVLTLTQFHAAAQDDWANIVSMCEIAKANRIKPVICSVLPVKQYKWRPEVTDCADRIIRLNAMLKEYARKNKITYVDYHSAMKDEENGLPEKWSYDGVHLNGEGYDVIESLILKAIK